MKNKKNSNHLNKKDDLIVDEYFYLPKKRGNGLLKRKISKNQKGEVTRYSLTYINHNLHNGDNGRVLGYDNAHGCHHKHYMGEIEKIEFINFEQIEELFQREFEVIYEKSNKK